MTREDIKKEIIKYSKKIKIENLSKGSGGNVSCIDREKSLIYITPTAIDYDQLKVEDISVIDYDSHLIEGKAPSSEWEMHSIIYQKYEDVGGIFHCHSIYATAMAILREPIPASSYLVAEGGSFEIPISDYATYGTKELGINAAKSLSKAKGCLLANHGQIATGTTIQKAYSLAVTIEECAKAYIIAKSAGKPTILPKEEMKKLKKKFENHGQPKTNP